MNLFFRASSWLAEKKQQLQEQMKDFRLIKWNWYVFKMKQEELIYWAHASSYRNGGYLTVSGRKPGSYSFVKCNMGIFIISFIFMSIPDTE